MIFKIILIAMMAGAVCYGMIAAVKNNNAETASDKPDNSNVTR
jgi:hypothetical protein